MFEDWHLELIERCRVGRLATVSADGRPHLVPVCYVMIDHQIVIPIDEKPKSGVRLVRLRNIERDPRVSLLVDHYDENWTQLAWVRVDGTATVLDRGAAMPAALAALRTRYQQYRLMRLEPLPLIVITPERVVAWHSRE